MTVTRGFSGRRRSAADTLRLPPGQYDVGAEFPVLSAGPTPSVRLESWDLRLTGALGTERRWTWEEFRALPRVPVRTDIHCVTTWSKSDTAWEGVSLDVLLDGVDAEGATHVMAHCDGGYTTNVPLEALLDDDVLVAHTYGGAPLEHDHGAPLRLLVPKRYFWKSAKFLRQLEVMPADREGFWELNGYHNDADPWKEQRHWF